MSTQSNPSAGASGGFGAMVIKYFRDFGVLRETKREYWGIQIVNFLDCVIYFGLLNIASVFLSEDIGLDDKAAGYSITLFTTATTIFLFFSGTVTDWLGIRRAALVAMVAQGGLRLGLVVVGLMPELPYRGWIATGLLLGMAPFMAMIQTVFQAANKRFTTERSRSAGFSLWYLVMNIGAAGGGFLIDIIRLQLKVSNAHVFTFGVGAAMVCSVVVLMFIRSDEQLGGGSAGSGEGQKPKVRRKPWQIAAEVFQEPAIYRLIVLILLLVGVRAIFSYLYLLMPKYWLRTIGEDARMGTLQAINPILIVVGIILFIPLVNRFRLFSMLVYGSMISAASLLVLAMPWQWFSADIAQAHYTMAILCMIVLSVGEVVWSPKLYEYTAAIAPEGQEGTYLGLSMVPWFLAKSLVSVLSGHLLGRWCAEGIGDRMVAGEVGYWDTPAAMWLVLALYAMGGCLIALVIRGWLTRGLKA
jgi:MFS family permease